MVDLQGVVLFGIMAVSGGLGLVYLTGIRLTWLYALIEFLTWVLLIAMVVFGLGGLVANLLLD